MTGSKADSNGRSAGLGSFGDKLWGLLLPGLLLFSVAGASWGTFLFQEAETERATIAEQMHLERSAQETAPQLGKLLASGEKERLHFIIRMLSQTSGGLVSLHDARGKTLVKSEGRIGITRDELQSHEEPGSRIDRTEKIAQILVWEPVLGPGTRKIGELRILAPLPVAAEYPWAFWTGLLGVFGLLSAIVMLVLLRLFEPVKCLGDFVVEVGKKDPFEIEVSEKTMKAYPDLGQAMQCCAEGLQQRQLRSEESFVEVAVNLAREYEYHAEGSLGHGQRTRRFASWLAERLRMPPVERDTLEVAALCHDIGRMPPSEGEPWGHDQRVERMHAELGAAYFEAMPGLEEVAEIVRYHHHDFSPDDDTTPSGEDLPLGARILRIVDSFERLVSGRDDESERGFEEALEEMEEGAGTLYDPDLFAYFREEAASRIETRKLFAQSFPIPNPRFGDPSIN